MYFEYKGYYFKLKALRDYKYLSNEEYSEFQWNIVKNFYNYLITQQKDSQKQFQLLNSKLKLYNDFTNLSMKQQNNLIMKSIILPKSYLPIYNERQIINYKNN
jgi:hypothetical protein